MRGLLGILILSFALTACTNGGSGDGDHEDVPDGDSGLSLSQYRLSATTDSAGLAAVQINVPRGTAAFSVTGRAPASRELRVKRLTTPSGTRYEFADEALRNSDGFAFLTEVSTINFPFVSEPVEEGSYSVVYEVSGSRRDPAGGQPIDITVSSKTDGDLSNGVLRINMILIEPVNSNTQARDDLETALSIWQQIFERAGILLDPQWYDFSGPNDLPDPEDGDPFYEGVARAVRPNSFNVIIGANVNGLGGVSDRYSKTVAGPGAVNVTPYSFAAFSLLRMTGGDGRFDFSRNRGNGSSGGVHNSEIRLAAEEMAEMCARYLGLQSIVEFQSGGSKVIGADDLTDTPSCTALNDCRADTAINGNITFPYPMRKDHPDSGEFNESNEYFARDRITEQQRRVMNLSVLVD